MPAVAFLRLPYPAIGPDLKVAEEIETAETQRGEAHRIGWRIVAFVTDHGPERSPMAAI